MSDRQRDRRSDVPFGRPAGSNGSHPHGMDTRPVPFDELVDEPIDLMTVQADDELLSALAAGVRLSAPGHSGYDADDQVAALLAAWKADVDDTPVPADLVSVDEALAAIEAGRPARRSMRARRLVPLAAAAALLVVTLGGVTVGAHSAEPGDALWGLSKVIYSDRAISVQAAANVKENLASVKTALAQGNTGLARQLLATMPTDIDLVNAEDGKGELADVQETLVLKLEETPVNTPTNPDAPLAAPERKSGQARQPAPSPPGEKPPPASPPPSQATTESPKTGTPAPGTGTGTSDPRSLNTGGSGSVSGSAGAPGTSTPPSGSEQPGGTTEGSVDPTTTTPAPPSGTAEGGADSTGTPSASGSGSVQTTS